MADYDCTTESQIVQGVGGVADRITLNGSLSQVNVEVLNVDGLSTISFRTDGTTAVAGAAENRCIPAVTGQAVQVPAVGLKTAGGHARVSIIAPGACKYQVSLVPNV